MNNYNPLDNKKPVYVNPFSPEEVAKMRKFSYNLPDGGHATFDIEPTEETITALNEMIKLAKKNCK